MLTQKNTKAYAAAMMGLLLAAGYAEATQIEINALRQAHKQALAELEAVNREIGELNHSFQAARHVYVESMGLFHETGDKYYYQKSRDALKRSAEIGEKLSEAKKRRAQLEESIKRMEAMLEFDDNGESNQHG